MNDFAINIARMAQKFLNKKPSVGYSHPPIIEADEVFFQIYDQSGRRFKVSVTETTFSDLESITETS